MVTVLALLGVLGVLFVAAVLATREGPVLADAPPDAADLALPEGPLRPQDVGAVRFSLAPRGYRMAQVDEVLDRLAAELADRDRRIAELEERAQGAGAGEQQRAAQPAAAAQPPAPVEQEPAPAPLPPVAPTALPPADLGTELVTEDRLEASGERPPGA